MLEFLKKKELVWFLAGVATGMAGVVYTYEIAAKLKKPAEPTIIEEE